MGCGTSSESSLPLQPASTTRPIQTSKVLNSSDAAQALMSKFPKPPKKGKPLSIYTMEQVQQHNSTESAWTVYRGNVYDITDFLDAHPGGENLLQEKAM